MSEQERESRRVAAQAANPGGKPDSAYWEEIPQLNTVGYLTTTAGALAVPIPEGRAAPYRIALKAVEDGRSAAEEAPIWGVVLVRPGVAPVRHGLSVN